MQRILHLVTAEPLEVASRIIEFQRQQADVRVERVDLGDADANYRELLDKIFEADSIQIWSGEPKPR